MTYRCPTCAAGTLEIEASLALPADARSDEIIVQLVACPACGLRAGAVYEESRRGRLDQESWDHTGYLLEPAALTILRVQVQACPDPTNPRCSCPSHRGLAEAEPNGRWTGLTGTRASFRMERHPGDKP